MRLLLVEDDASLRETLSESLRREGFEVIATGDGGEALELARTTQPDLIILDLMLPTLDGLSVCRILRKETDVPISCSPPAAGRWTASSVWRWARTITW